MQDPTASLGNFCALNLQLVGLLESSRGLGLDQTVLVSPFAKSMKYSAYSAFALIAAHNRRHLWQRNVPAADMRQMLKLVARAKLVEITNSGHDVLLNRELSSGLHTFGDSTLLAIPATTEPVQPLQGMGTQIVEGVALVLSAQKTHSANGRDPPQVFFSSAAWLRRMDGRSTRLNPA